MAHSNKTRLDQVPLSRSALRVIETIEQSPDKYLTASQYRMYNAACIDLLNHGLLVASRTVDDIEVYRLSRLYDPRTILNLTAQGEK